MDPYKYKIFFNEILDTTATQLNVRFANIASLKFLPLCNSSQFENFNNLFFNESLMNIYGDFFDKNFFFLNELMAVYAHEKKGRFHNNDIETIL